MRVPSVATLVGCQVLLFALALAPRPAFADDDAVLPARTSTPLLSTFTAAPPTFTAPSFGLTPIAARPAPRASRGLLVPFYAGFAALQMLDAHSTIYATDRGSIEGNPIVRHLADRPALFVGTKAAVAFSTIVAADQLQRRHRVAALVMMAAVNSAYAAVVVHNYRSVR